MEDFRWNIKRNSRDTILREERQDQLLCLSIKEKELNIKLLEFSLTEKQKEHEEA